MNERLLTWESLKEIVPFVRAHITRMERAGQFPQRLQIGPNRVACRQSEVLAWIESRERGTLEKRECLRRAG
jgi:prophage regulatory protein